MSEKFALWEAGGERKKLKPLTRPPRRVMPSFEIHRYVDGGVEIIEPGPWSTEHTYPEEEN